MSERRLRIMECVWFGDLLVNHLDVGRGSEDMASDSQLVAAGPSVYPATRGRPTRLCTGPVDPKPLLTPFARIGWALHVGKISGNSKYSRARVLDAMPLRRASSLNPNESPLFRAWSEGDPASEPHRSSGLTSLADHVASRTASNQPRRLVEGVRGAQHPTRHDQRRRAHRMVRRKDAGQRLCHCRRSTN